MVFSYREDTSRDDKPDRLAGARRPGFNVTTLSMANTPDLITRTRDALSGVPDVVEKKMFGSTGFMVRGKLCIGARADRIMCRVNPADHAALVKRKGCTTVVMKGRVYNGYVHLAADALQTQKALAFWIDLALRYNASIAVVGA